MALKWVPVILVGGSEGVLPENVSVPLEMGVCEVKRTFNALLGRVPEVLGDVPKQGI